MVRKNKKSTLQKELIILCVITCVTAMIVQGIILTSVFAKIFAEKAKEDIKFYIEKVDNEFNNKLQFVEDAITYIRNDSIMDQFFNGTNYNKDEINKSLIYTSNIFSERNMINENYPFITEIFLFNNNGDNINNIFYPTTMEKLKLLTDEYSLMQSNFSKQNLEYYFKLSENGIAIIFKVYDKELQEKGNCIVKINNIAIKEIFKGIEKYANFQWIILGNDEVLIEANNIDNSKNTKLNINNLKSEKKDKYFFSENSNSFGMKTIVMVSKSNIYDYIKSSLILMIIIITLLLLCIATIVFFVAYRFTIPLKIVATKIKEFGGGNFDTKIEEFKTQELEDISLVFNEMTDKINYLIKQVYENQLLATKAQIRYLQSQINPHFMFNILSMIGIKAKMSQNDEIHKMIYAFSKLIQGKIFRKEEITIPLKEEMELIEFYLFLQSSRFSDRISYNIAYEYESLKEVLIPRLSIEPIVENAVLHGLEPKEEKGSIDVFIQRKENCLLIEVKDDGVGFNQDVIVPNEDKEHTHVGIFNTQRLIQNLYGKDFGIEIKSKIGGGTSVFIKLPI